ncbi:HEAT repeat domain-containing protein [Janthinobacterium sp. 17J80-10]|uniref:HEAT repeat domain-containing protein n=1 Tax=Janthinobacterium sp. 17J80-10 TaxID=2497863 RepID=UPI0010056C82|nr:HEAT repeat domain-containing protein [Janthinobacterium sp. 17J80-10]QAU34787.1 HEAT repeat domain-containing protein [Janthinobacterium sp. 17J80-10]
MKISIPVLFGCSGISFALGFILAWQALPEGAPPVARAAAQGAAGANQVADLWNGRGAPTHVPSPVATNNQHQVAPVSGEEQKMRERAETDPVFLRSLIQRYETERKPEMREMIKSVLASVQKPEALAFFTRLANSGDTAQRKEAYAMLQQMAPDSPEMRNLLKQALASEQSPELLAQAVAALRPGATDPAESEAIMAQLGSLAQHADPAVRSQSVLQLGQWDKTGASQGRLAQALADPSPEVRQAAIFAVAQSGARSDALKSTLMGIINNGAESKEIKGSALQVLERFPLSKEEYARYVQARTQAGH